MDKLIQDVREMHKKQRKANASQNSEAFCFACEQAIIASLGASHRTVPFDMTPWTVFQALLRTHWLKKLILA